MDPRIKELSALLTGYSCALKPGEKVLIDYEGECSKPLVRQLIKDAYKALLNKYETLLNKQVDKYQKMIDEQSKCQYYCRFANNKFLCYTHRCLYFFTKKWNSIKVFVEHYKWRRG